LIKIKRRIANLFVEQHWSDSSQSTIRTMGCQVFTEMAVAKITIRNPVRCSGSKCRSDKSCKFSRFRACTQYFITTFGETMRFFRKILYLKLHPYTTFFDTPQLRIS